MTTPVGTDRRSRSDLSRERPGLRAWIREVLAEELTPHADAWEAAAHFPDEVFTTLAGHGLLGLKYPREVGGEGGDVLDDAVLVEELARCRSGGLAAGIGAHIGIASPPIFRFGTPGQLERHLVPAIRGEAICALAITEPDAGSDVAAVRTRAERVDGGFLVNGAKTYITNGVRADRLVCAVRTTADGGHHGMSFLVVERGPGVESAPLRKLGWHASDTATVTFDDVFVPEEELLGELHGGFRLVMANFAWERLLMALGAVAAMEDVLERTWPLVHGQAEAHALASAAATTAAGRAICDRALLAHHAGEDATTLVVEAKLATQRAAVDVLDRCLDVHARAQSPDQELVERALRDARLGPIGGGTDEIMKEILGKSLAL